MIEPHGGELVNRTAENEKKNELKNKAKDLPSIKINFDELTAVNNIATGLFSPIEGFMTKKDYQNVVANIRLADGTVWSIPIILGVTPEEADNLKKGQDVALYFEEDNKLYAILHLEEKYKYDQKKEAKNVYGTKEKEHPGVAQVYERDEILLGGKITLIRQIDYNNFDQYRLTPAETRKKIKKKGWDTVVGFQTRNPIHRAHEYLKNVLWKCRWIIYQSLSG